MLQNEQNEGFSQFSFSLAALCRKYVCHHCWKLRCLKCPCRHQQKETFKMETSFCKIAFRPVNSPQFVMNPEIPILQQIVILDTVMRNSTIAELASNIMTLQWGSETQWCQTSNKQTLTAHVVQCLLYEHVLHLEAVVQILMELKVHIS